MNRINRWKNISLLALLVALCLVMAACGDKREDAAARTPKVRYLELKGQSLTLTRELPGRVSAYMVSEVRPQVSGIILERLFEEGADVEEGQVLYQIDPALFQATYNNAKANLARAEANLVSARLLAQRYATIVKEDAVSRQEYDNAVAAHGQAKAEVDAARAALETAGINLGYTKVTAPVSGRIGRSFVTPGALVTQNQAQPLATVQQISHVYVDVTQSNSELLRLRRALSAGRLRSGGPDSAKVRLKLEDGSPYAARSGDSAEGLEWIEGDLLFSDVTIEPSTGVVNIRAKFENRDNILLPGMYVRAVLEEGVREAAILVPQRAVQRDTRGRPYVYVLSGQEPAGRDAEAGESVTPGPDEFYVEQRMIELDRDYRNQWLVQSGLREGELLLVDGVQKSRPGALVAGLRLESESSSLAEKDGAPSSPAPGTDLSETAESAGNDQEQAG